MTFREELKVIVRDSWRDVHKQDSSHKYRRPHQFHLMQGRDYSITNID